MMKIKHYQELPKKLRFDDVATLETIIQNAGNKRIKEIRVVWEDIDEQD